MKHFLLLTASLFSFCFSNGQTIGPDNEKLINYYQSQQYGEAAAYLKGIYKEDTEDTKELSQLAYVNLMAGRLTEAEIHYLKLYSKLPKNVSVLFNLANLSIRRGNDEKAKGYYKEILKIDSTSFNAYKQLAALSSEGNPEEKMAYLISANRLNQTEGDVAFDLCEIYFRMKRVTDAKKVLDPALKADSLNLRLLKMKMPIDMSMLNYKASIQTGQQLLSYGDSSSFVLNNLAKSYYLMLDYPNALKYFLIAEEKSDGNETLFYNIGLSYRGIKDYKNAIPYLQKAIKEGISPGIASYYGLLGDSYEMTSKNDAANTAYKKGLQFENNGTLLYNIALLHETRLNDKKNAINYYEQYLKTIDPVKQPRQVIFIKNKIAELKKF
ncbi:tetratricopeptide repeat protein [Pedobacter africanus]|uniref:Tetratricopeptide repeat-containing protein n=1 Tax=Pedobacter africanus TaxID=151894 RepID=A0A1W1ZQ69_9SPHI|nr:tetratricopeptide repeat protein [Pedobacter africanus]SMC50352.1 Tetratricopeptide repeat-containing protein [Pedobacter africanus]